MLARLPSLAGALELERVDDRRFRRVATTAGRLRIFGGASLAHGLLAAGMTVAGDMWPHVLQARFIRPGKIDVPLDLIVDPFTDRGSFAHRRVSVCQNGAEVVEVQASFHRAELGPEWQQAPVESLDPLQVPAIDELGEPAQAWAEALADWLPFEVRSEALPGWRHRSAASAGIATQRVWLRGHTDHLMPLEHAAAAAYASDLFLLTAGMKPHGLRHDNPNLLAVTLNHTVWFHAELRAGDWWRYDQEGNWTAQGRALCRGQLFDQAGRLLATSMQEGLLRVAPEKSTNADVTNLVPGLLGLASSSKQESEF